VSTWTKLRRELSSVNLTDGEWRGLRHVISLGGKQGFPPNAKVEIPGITAAGKAYLLTIPTDAQGKPTKIVVDLNPDLSSPAFDAYTVKRAEWEAEDKAADSDQSSGSGGRQ
jgi:hypothetical protein